LQASAAVATGQLAVYAPAPVPVVLGAAHAISTGTLALVQLGDRWPPGTALRWDMDLADRWLFVGFGD
jgi:hypothetical protein